MKPTAYRLIEIVELLVAILRQCVLTEEQQAIVDSVDKELFDGTNALGVPVKGA